MGRAILMLAIFLPGQTAAWKVFAPEQGGFKISLPGEPKVHEAKIKDGTKDHAVQVFVLEMKDDTVYTISVTALPTMAKLTDQRLDAARDGAVLSSKGKLKGEKKITLDGVAGRDLNIETETQGVRTRIYASKDRLFQTMVIGTKKAVEAKEATQFLDSFGLVR